MQLMAEGSDQRPPSGGPENAWHASHEVGGQIVPTAPAAIAGESRPIGSMGRMALVPVEGAGWGQLLPFDRRVGMASSGGGLLSQALAGSDDDDDDYVEGGRTSEGAQASDFWSQAKTGRTDLTTSGSYPRSTAPLALASAFGPEEDDEDQDAPVIIETGTAGPGPAV